MFKIRNTFIVIAALLAFVSCSSDKDCNYTLENDPIISTASPVILNSGKNIIDLNDFILDFSNIDSICYESNNYTYDSKKHLLTISEDFENINPLSIIKIYYNNCSSSIICKKNNKITTEIVFTPKDIESYTEVSIAGDFNGWNPDNTKMKEENGIWIANLCLDQGLYQYQIVADGQWMNNYPAGDTVANGIGGYNTSLNIQDHCETDGFIIQTVDFTETDIKILTSYIPDRLFIFWGNHLIPVNLENFVDNNYTFTIPEEAKNVERSHIRIYANHKDCISNDLLIPLQNGKVIHQTAQLNRADKHTNIMYFMLVDRFNNGDSQNDFPLNDSRVHDKADYQGGDLQGIQNKLNDEYFEQLGINCLWISPIFQNPKEAYQEFPEPRRFYSGYHGYWPISSTEIDYRFGTDSTFSGLVNSAHEKEINVILDFVANHVHENHPLYQAHKDWATQLVLDDGRTNVRIWDEMRLTTWFDTFLPSWDFENPEVTDTISNYALYWLEKFDLDGFRHDATKHIPEVFWQTLTHKIKSNFPDKSIYQVGETFGSRELIGNYVGSGMLDGQFDFNLYFDARNAFADSNSDMRDLVSSLNASLNAYGHFNLMGNISGNHDIIRFISLADKSVLPGEDDKEAGWERHIIVQNPESYKKLQNLAAFIMSIPGIPCIYYGDEIGMPGVGDPDNRRMMRFDSLSNPEALTLAKFKLLIDIRKSNIEFIYGTTLVVDAGKNYMVIKRQYFDHISYILFNNSDQNIDILISKNKISNIDNFKTYCMSEIAELSTNYQIKVQANSFEIISNK